MFIVIGFFSLALLCMYKYMYALSVVLSCSYVVFKSELNTFVGFSLLLLMHLYIIEGPYIIYINGTREDDIKLIKFSIDT